MRIVPSESIGVIFVHEYDHLSRLELGTPPPDKGRPEAQSDREGLLRMLAALREKDWVADAFGKGEAAEFMRHCINKKLNVVQAIEHLADRVPHFSDPAQLELVARALGRHPDAGPVFRRLVTPDLLRRVHHTR